MVEIPGHKGHKKEKGSQETHKSGRHQNTREIYNEVGSSEEMPEKVDLIKMNEDEVSEEKTIFSYKEGSEINAKIEPVPEVGKEFRWKTQDGSFASSKIKEITQLDKGAWLIKTELSNLLLKRPGSIPQPKEDNQETTEEIKAIMSNMKEGWKGSNSGGVEKDKSPDDLGIEVPDFSIDKNVLNIDSNALDIDTSEIYKDFNNPEETDGSENTETEVEEDPGVKQNISEKPDPDILKEKSAQSNVNTEQEKQTEPKTEESPEKIIKSEYFKLRNEFRAAESEFYDSLDSNYELKNILGIGRDNLKGEAKEAYDKMMEANKAYFKYGQESGIHDKINARLNRDKENKQSVKPALAARHVIRLAENRLEHQSLSLGRLASSGLVSEKKKNLIESAGDSRFASTVSSGAEKTKDFIATNIGGLIKKHPNISRVGFAVLTGGASWAREYLNNKFNVKAKNAEVDRQKKEETTKDAFNQDGLDLELLEKAYFSEANQAQRAEKTATAVNVAMTGVTIAAGGINGYSIAEGVSDLVSDSAGDIGEGAVHGVEGKIRPAESSVGFGLVREISNAEVTGLEPVTTDMSVYDTSDMSEASPSDLPEIQAVDEYQIPDSEKIPEFYPANAEGVENPGGLPDIASKPDTPYEPLPDHVPANAEGTIDSGVEQIEQPPHQVQTGDNTSTILSNSLRQQVESGDFTLPPSADNASQYLYQQVPELTNAQGVEPRFTAEQWKAWGIESGNPQDITPTDTIDTAKIIEALQSDSSVVSPDVASGSEPQLEEVTLQPEVDNYETLPSQVDANAEGAIPTEATADSASETNIGVESAQEGVSPEAKTAIKNYFTETHVFSDGFNDLRSHLADELMKDYKSGLFDLPADAQFRLNQNPDYIYTLVDRAFPGLTPDTGLLSVGSSIEPPAPGVSWEQLGVGSDPANIANGSEVQIGKLRSLFLEDIADDYKFTSNDQLLDIAGEKSVQVSLERQAQLNQEIFDKRLAELDEMSKNGGPEIIAEPIKMEVPPDAGQTPDQPSETPASDSKPELSKEEVKDAANRTRRVIENPNRAISDEIAKKVEEQTGIPKRDAEQVFRAGKRVLNGADPLREAARQVERVANRF